MSRFVPVLALLLAFTLPAFALDGLVVGVSDGDTVSIIDAQRNRHKVRLHGIDAPEKAQPFGQVAKRHLSDLVYGKTVTVVEKGQDKYRRTLGVVMLNGNDVNALMVRDGLAWAYRKYSRDYEQQEGEARTARRGLWGDSDPVPPWDWRRARR